MSKRIRPYFLSTAAAAFLAAAAPTFAAEIDVIEFHNTVLNHYFITNPTEAAWIEAGNAGPGWVRTGLTFKASDSSAPGFVATCRFYTQGANSHFYAAAGSECDYLKSLNPGNALGPDVWTYEGFAFHVQTPVGGQCPTGTQPVYRMYNNRAAQRDSNHRFSTQAAVSSEMTARGWTVEGVAMCAGAPVGSLFQQEVTSYTNTVLGLASGEVADMDTLEPVMMSALMGALDPSWTCPQVTSNPPLASLEEIPASLAISFTYGVNGCNIDATTKLSGSGSINLTGLVFTDTALKGSIGITLNDIRINDMPAASGGLTGAFDLAFDGDSGVVSGTVNTNLNDLLLAGSTGGNGTLDLTLQPSGAILADINLITLPHGTPVTTHLSIVPQPSGAVTINTTGTENSVGSYALQITNLIIDPNLCEQHPIGGQIAYTKEGQTGTISFTDACSGSYGYVGP